MVDMARARVEWTGGVPGGGLSTFYCASVSPDFSALKAWFTALAPYLPPSVTIHVPGSGDLVDMASGHITGAYTATGSGTVVGTGNSAWSNGVGMAVQWGTTLIVGGRRLKGRTFVCPLAQGFASADGTLNDAIVTAVQTASNTLVAADLIRVWHRPKPSAPTSGTWSPVVAAVIPDRVTALRSRRY